LIYIMRDKNRTYVCVRRWEFVNTKNRSKSGSKKRYAFECVPL
jgi:hypothetical protein